MEEAVAEMEGAHARAVAEMARVAKDAEEAAGAAMAAMEGAHAGVVKGMEEAYAVAVILNSNTPTPQP